MAKWNEMKRALVTGAAGLIGSHVVDLLVREGWQVRALDNLEPQTHRRGKPAWINPKAEFIQGDMRNRDAITAALDGIDVVFHQAAYGGYMPEIAKYVHVNSLGTAQMLEVIREKKSPDQKDRRCQLAGRLQRRRGRMSEARIGLSKRPPDRAIASRRLAGALPDLRSDHKKRSHAGERAGRWRNRLRADES